MNINSRFLHDDHDHDHHDHHHLHRDHHQGAVEALRRNDIVDGMVVAASGFFFLLEYHHNHYTHDNHYNHDNDNYYNHYSHDNHCDRVQTPSPGLPEAGDGKNRNTPITTTITTRCHISHHLKSGLT